MSLIETLKSDLVEAMKEKDKNRLNTLRAVKGAMQLEVINKKVLESDELLLDVINKQIKMRNDSITEFEKAGRDDLIESYKSEIDILNKYMPKQLNDDELDKIIEDGIKKAGATSSKQMGLVMKEITPLIKNKCDMKSVTNKIKEKLN